MLPAVVAAAALVVFFALALALLLKKGSGDGGLGQQQEAQEAEALRLGAAARGMGRPAAAMRRRRRRGAQAAAASDDEGGSEDEGGGRQRGAAAEDDGEDGGAAGAAQFKRRDAYEARRAARDAEREAQEAEVLRAAEERRLREEEEAARWMHMFSVEGAGEEAQSREEGEVLLSRMVDYIQQRKVVPLDELAAEFGLKTQEVIQRVRELEQSDRITGLMDDRGKFIHISREEMQAVAEFIRQRGRVAISELAAKSSTFIDLSAREVAAGELDLSEPLQAGA